MNVKRRSRGARPRSPRPQPPATPLATAAAASLHFRLSPDPAAIFDGRGRLLAVNPACQAEGAPGPTLSDAPLEQLVPFWIDPEGRERLLHGALKPGGVSNLELTVPLDDGTREKVFWVSAKSVGVGMATRVIASARQMPRSGPIPEREQAPRTPPGLLYRDPVTGFLTRETFQVLLEEALGKAERDGRPLALLAFDLDDFKALNDTHGLAAGDEYLRALGIAVGNAVRPEMLVARLGGDEFGIVYPETSLAEAALEADNVLRLLGELSAYHDGRKLQLTASLGVAVYPEHGAKASDLMLAADLAMHQAKRRGRARFQLHDPSTGERERIGVLRRQADRIRGALGEGLFVPVFQPIAEVASGRVVGVETLVRLREEDGTLVSPESFLDAAERFGFVTAIDRVVITGAFDALIAARRRISPDLEVSINLSGLDFEDDTLVADISRMARAKGVRPSRITFEITETAALRDLGRVQDFTRALTSEGFRFALDDFGVGYSSFRYLRDLPMATLKFDQSYVKDLPKKLENRVFVRGIAEICRGLGVKTVAEGVETPEILSILRELGVDRAQGYFVGSPVPELPPAASAIPGLGR